MSALELFHNGNIFDIVNLYNNVPYFQSSKRFTYMKVAGGRYLTHWKQTAVIQGKWFHRKKGLKSCCKSGLHICTYIQRGRRKSIPSHRILQTLFQSMAYGLSDPAISILWRIQKTDRLNWWLVFPAMDKTFNHKCLTNFLQ